MHKFLLWPRPYSNKSTQTHILFYLTHHLALLSTLLLHRHLPIPTNIFPFHTTSEKLSLDKENLTNYRPISNLSTISKITERVVKTRLINHLSSNSVLNPYQSTYSKNHHWSYPSITAWSSLQSMPSWPICCLRHPWQLYYSLGCLLDSVSPPSPSAVFALTFRPAHLQCL